MKIKEDKDITINSFDYLSIKRRSYIDMLGSEQSWHFVSRKGKKAVVIIPTFDDKILFIKQFRIPFASFVYEFPAGIIDVDNPNMKDVEDAAKRELEEETGYRVQNIVYISPQSSASCGISDEEFYFVRVQCFPNPGKQNTEPSEEIETMVLSKDKIKSFLNSVVDNNEKIDGRLYLYLREHYV